MIFICIWTISGIFPKTKKIHLPGKSGSDGAEMTKIEDKYLVE